MAWWRKVLSTVPFIFAGYEVGKVTEPREKHSDLKTVEILLIVIIILIAIVVAAKIIHKAMSKSVKTNTVIQSV